MDPQLVGALLSPLTLAVLGLLIGSFLNVVIHRMPLMMERGWRMESAELLGVTIEPTPEITLSTPRSRCPSCGHQIRWYENIPVVSYLSLRGKCSACKAPISMRYPAIEILTGLLFAACGVHFGAQPTVLLWCGFAATLVALAFIDLDTSFLPDDLTLPLMWVGIVSAALGWIPVTLSASVAGAVIGYLSLWFVFHAYRLIRGKEGMGAGDFKLLAALGAWMGWQAIPSIILLSSAVGAIVGIALIVFRRHDRDVPIPFGPYLAGGGVAALFFGEQLSRLWMPPV
ncbi:A24 family peptidase [Rhizobacter sp. Root404]|uniref:prepilin peptidase n=1 Tax=Rhizobacter sp. Root404 TaxID=1736528 RepID=UPI000AD33499|nr:A24 family peptidase [Rhizobacter sp. Root404]